jgi:hypothetical protein
MLSSGAFIADLARARALARALTRSLAAKQSTAHFEVAAAFAGAAGNRRTASHWGVALMGTLGLFSMHQAGWAAQARPRWETEILTAYPALLGTVAKC